MPENKNQTVPIGQFLALKEKVKKYEGDNLAHQNRIAELENALQIAQANANDPEDIAKVKAMLAKQDKEFATKLTKYNEEVASFEEGRKQHRAEKLAFDLKAKGVETTPESLLEEEDMEGKANSLILEHLTQENEKLKATPATQPKVPPPASQVYEAGAPALTKTQPKDMDDKTFESYVKGLEAEALAKK